jgi:putative NIF3 family GTP cyclohydrolase 1 type 2
MKVQEIVDSVFDMAPNPPWGDENKFEFGDGSDTVTGVAVAWWITSDIMREMGERNLQLGLTHEPAVYELVPSYRWGKTLPAQDLAVNQNIARLASGRRLTIHRFHSNLDLAGWGMGRAVLDQLGWKDCLADWSRGVPVVDIQPTRLRDLIAHVKARLNLPFIRYDGNLDRLVRRVTVPWGGMCVGWDGTACASPLGFDAIIGGDITDGLVRFARENGWAVIDAMHHATEMEGMRRLTTRLQERFPNVRIEFFKNSCPWKIA